MVFSFGRQICADFNAATKREWLETNGLGSYALSNICLCATKRYHGLLVVSTGSTAERIILLNTLEEKISGPGWSREISCQKYTEAIHPQGFEFLEEFSLSPFPVFTYLVENARIKKTFFLVSGENTAVIMYELLSGPPVQIEIRPLVSFRPLTALLKKDDRFEAHVHHHQDSVRIVPDNLPPLGIKATSGFFQPAPCWYYHFSYEDGAPTDREGAEEDLFCPGVFRFPLLQDKRAALIASTENLGPLSMDKLFYKEQFIRSKIVEQMPMKGDGIESFLQAGDQFVISTPRSTHIIQGYPWLGESMRHTFMSLPGLCLANGRFPEAKEIIVRYVESANSHPHSNDTVKQARGRTPGEVETDLWFIWAVQKYVEHSGDLELVRSIHGFLTSIYQVVRKGVPGVFKMDVDGLIAQEDNADGIAEKNAGIQALWYNALQFIEEIEIKTGGKRKRYKDLALRVRESFNTQFWNEQTSYVYAGIRDNRKDPSIVPEALLSISLPYSVLDQKRFNHLFNTAWNKLYTSYGLRSCAQDDQHFSSRSRDMIKALQEDGLPRGSVYPFWIGPFINAYFRVFGQHVQTKARARQFLTPFINHLSESLVGSIGEAFDGNPPHEPRGCPAYALSVAEIIRVLVEEIGCRTEHKVLSIADVMSPKP